MKPSATRTFIPALLASALLVVAFNSWFAFRTLNVLLDNQRWVEHTWQVIFQVERIMNLAKDAETGNRGFLLTGDNAYLQPFSIASRELPLQLDKFAGLTVDNPLQGKLLLEARAVLEQRFNLLREEMELRRAGNLDSVRTLVLSGTGEAEMDHLRVIADRQEAEEYRLLVIRMAQTEAATHLAFFSVGLASALDLLLILAIFRYLSHERKLRLATEEAAKGLAIAHAETEAQTNEVRLLNATLEQRVQLRTAELETTNRELEAFSYSVSHDLRAPLRTIDGFSLALEEDYAEAVDATGRDYIRRVRKGVQRMGQLIDALLQLSRITRAEIVREEVNLSDLAEIIVADLKTANPDREIVFEVEGNLHASADPKLIQVALENLLGNAVKFSAKVAHPSVAFGCDRQQNAFFVRDNGAGFDMYYSDKLFNAFNRLHGDKDFAGSGIGLATVARVIRRHHGRIWADSVVDHGATFWFTLG